MRDSFSVVQSCSSNDLVEAQLVIKHIKIKRKKFMGKKSKSSTTKQAKVKDRWTYPSFADKTSGDILCDFLYPYSFSHSMAALEI